MASQDRQRRERGDATRIAIIEAAEELFAEHGINGTSLRQIGVASGSANTNVVAYHFGDKDNVVEAIIRHRLIELEEARAQLLQKWDDDGRVPTMLDLLFILFHPVMQQRNHEGKRSYAAFLGGVFRSGSAWRRYSFGANYPVTRRVLMMLEERSGQSKTLFRSRMKICTNMVVSALDLLGSEGMVDSKTEAQQFMDALAMAEAGLLVPPPACR